MPNKTRKNTKRKKPTRNYPFDPFEILRAGRLKASTKKFPTSNNIQTAAGILFVILGLLFLYKVPIVKTTIQKTEPIVASSEFRKTDNESNVSRILIPKENIDLTVKHARIIGGYWETSETTASHGDGSSNPGTGGNVVIFAHARVGLFYNLKDVKKDDIIYVFTKDRWYRYKVGEIKSVYPADVTTVSPTKKEVLTLFTCSGFFDEKRLIVKAYPAN